MGLTKSDLFTQEQNELAAIAKALAHPARIAIIQHLIKANACINSDLVNELGLAQATISQHLKELKKAEIIQGTIEGVAMNYCINPRKWNEIRTTLNDLFDGFKHSCTEDNCC